jgi:hypothetical protein
MSKMIDAEENQKADGEPQDRGDAQLDALMATADDGLLAAIKSTVDLEAGVAHVLSTTRVPPANPVPAQAPASSPERDEPAGLQAPRKRGNPWLFPAAGGLGSVGAAVAVAFGVAASTFREAFVAIVVGSSCVLASLTVVVIGVAAYATSPGTLTLETRRAQALRACLKAASAGRDTSVRQKSEKQCRP